MAKHNSLTIGKDSRETIKAARAKAGKINDDITFDRFDLTLNRYGKESTVLEVVSPIQSVPQISLRQLWDKYLADKLPHIKHKTQDECRPHTYIVNQSVLLLK